MAKPISEARAGILARASSCFERFQVPGAVVGIQRDDQIEITPYGVTSLETGFPVREGTVFQIGSITKPFVATLIMTLVDDGLVNLDAQVVDYVPDLKLADTNAAKQITVRQLLIHTSGFWGDWFADFGLADDAIEQFVGRYDQLEQLTQPGELWAYNNCGFILAGLVAARVTGKTFEQATTERIFEPLGLTSASLSAADAIAHPLAVGHLSDIKSGAPRVAHQYLRPRCRNPAGGIVASARDVLTFAQLHLGHEPGILSEASLVEMHRPQVDTYETGVSWGLGFSIERRSGATIIGHGGSTNGFRASMSLVPEHDFALVILTNSDRGAAAAAEITDDILETYCGIAPDDPPSIILEPQRMQLLAGQYQQPHGAIDVELLNDQLRMRTVSQTPFSEASTSITGPWRSLRAIGDDEFIIVDGDQKGNHLRFWFDDQGEVRFLQAGGRLYRPAAQEGATASE